MVFKQNENWKNPNGTYGPKLPRSSPPSLKVNKTPSGQYIVSQRSPLGFPSSPDLTTCLKENILGWGGVSFDLLLIAWCFFRSYRIYWALWVFKKKCFFVLWMNFCDSGGISVLRVDQLSGIWHIVAFPARQGYTNFTFFCPLHCILRELQWFEAFY